MIKLSNGTCLVSSTLRNICFKMYIATLGTNNYEIQYKFKINDTLELGLSTVTENTKHVRCAFLHACSDRYQGLCYVSRRRVERLFDREVKKYPVRKALERNLISQEEINRNLILTSKSYKNYLLVLSKIFELSIIILEYDISKKVETIRNGDEYICILKKDNIFIPVCINDNYNINPELEEIIKKYFLEEMIINNIELKETEDINSNKDKIKSCNSRHTLNTIYDDNLYNQDRNGIIIKSLISDTKEDVLRNENEKLKKENEELKKIIKETHIHVQRGRGKDKKK